MQEDWELLRRYVDQNKEDAFASLVQRHGGWLLNALLRQLKNEDAAIEVRQQTFTLLAQKASALIKPTGSLQSGMLLQMESFVD